MAFLKGSRYAGLDRFSPPADSSKGFQGVLPRPVLPATPVLEHTVATKERLDQLAHNYYRNPRDWIRLAEANPEAIFPENLIWEPDPLGEDGSERDGHVLLIPRRTEEAG